MARNDELVVGTLAGLPILEGAVKELHKKEITDLVHGGARHCDRHADRFWFDTGPGILYSLLFVRENRRAGSRACRVVRVSAFRLGFNWKPEMI